MEATIEDYLKFLEDLVMDNDRVARSCAQFERTREILSKFNINGPIVLSVTQMAGLPWILTAKWIELNGCVWLVMLVSCNEMNASNVWSCDAEVQVKIIQSQRILFNGRVWRTTFRKNHDTLCIGLMKKEDILNPNHRLVTNNEVQLLTTINVISTFGIRNENISDYRTPSNTDSEVCLKVEDRRMYVDKYILIAFSPFFRALFLSDFAERDLHEIPLPDVGYEEMQCFLNVLRQASQPINANNVECLLKLADRFLVNFIMNKCEEFLINSTFSVRQKLELAEKYSFSLLQRLTLERITSIDEIREICPNTSILSKRTATILLERVFALSDPSFERELKFPSATRNIFRRNEPP